MLIERNRAIALRFAQAGWAANQGWEKIWDELMAADVVYHFNSNATPIIGLEANKAFNFGLFEGFPDIQHRIEDVIVEGEIVYRTTLAGTHTGDFLGIPPIGKLVKNINDFTLLRIVNSKIVEWWYECNLLAVMQQLGLIPDSKL